MFDIFKKAKKEPENLDEVLAKLNDLEKKFEKVSDGLEGLKKKNKFAVQKVGIVRFNPFREVGGDQSFSLALLDDNENGVVITSYYTRKENTVYGKPIKAGQSPYPLSEEEQEAIKTAKDPENSVILNGGKKNGKKNSKKTNDSG